MLYKDNVTPMKNKELISKTNLPQMSTKMNEEKNGLNIVNELGKEINQTLLCTANLNRHEEF